MNLVYQDWSNKIARAIDAPDGYTNGEFIDLVGSAQMFMFAARALFTEQGIENARLMADGRPVLAHINVLHGRLPGYTSTWEFDQNKAALTSGQHALNEVGEPAIRFKNKNSGEHQYHMNAALGDPYRYAQFIAVYAERFPVDGVLIDYMSETPWTYPDDPALPFENVGGLLWQNYQVAFVWHLRNMLGSDAVILANGRWAADQPAWVSNSLLSGVFWERCGTHWWSPQEAIELMHRHRGGIHLYDGRDATHSMIWNMPQLAQTLAMAHDQWYVVGPRNGEVLV